MRAFILYSPLPPQPKRCLFLKNVRLSTEPSCTIQVGRVEEMNDNTPHPHSGALFCSLRGSNTPGHTQHSLLNYLDNLLIYQNKVITLHTPGMIINLN